MALGKIMTFMASHNVPARGKGVVFELFRELGDVLEVEGREITAYTALSSSGIAYAFKYMEASAKGGVDMGIDPQKAIEVVVKTVEGAVALMQAHNEAPSGEILRVATPGGLTEKGLAAMDESWFTEAVIRGLWATR